MSDIKTVRVRFRRTITLGGVVQQANTVTTVDVNDEIWHAINRGDADMDPAPGVDGQPFPPEFLTKAPASVVATVQPAHAPAHAESAHSEAHHPEPSRTKKT